VTPVEDGGMRIGVFLVAAGFPGMEAGEVVRNTVEAVVAAEEAGFDDAWIAEHHFMSYGVCPSAATLAGVALGRTRRITVGTAVSVMSTHHPVALAEQAAVLHHASGGRFRLGVGRGGPWVDLEVFGTGLERYERGFPESLDLLCAALSRERVAADGEFFRFREVTMVPGGTGLRPVVACTSSATVGLAAKRGLPMLLGMHIGDAEKAAMLEEYARARGAPGGGHMAAAGGFVGSVVVASLADSKRAPTYLRIAGAVGAAGLIAVGFAPGLVPALAAMLFVGGGIAAFQTLNNSVALKLADPAYFGRVMGLMQVAWGMINLTSLPVGALADAFGERIVLSGAGAGLGIALLALTVWERRLVERSPVAP